ncbi:MAG TPA: RHS repeat-associated core domain-containing protein [Waddliaceae bacterium]
MVGRYYPFGLTMAGISDKANKTNYALNRYRYNGKELQNQEFSDGSGLELYDFGARMQDPQLGLFHNLDPFGEKYASLSPYSYAGNNPIKNIEVGGKYFVSLHYLMTRDVLLEYGIDYGQASDLAHYASVYADHPGSMALAISNASYGYQTTLSYWPNSSLYWNTRNSQNTTWTPAGQDPTNPENINYNIWHSMRSTWEEKQYDKGLPGGISAEQAMYRGMHFGWDNIFSSAKTGKLKNMEIGSQAIEQFGQGVHALQDAYAHQGRADVGISHILDDRNEVNKGQAIEITRSAVFTHLLISGDFETLNGKGIQDGSISITTTGMNSDQISQVINAAKKYLEYNRNKN